MLTGLVKLRRTAVRIERVIIADVSHVYCVETMLTFLGNKKLV